MTEQTLRGALQELDRSNGAESEAADFWERICKAKAIIDAALNEPPASQPSREAFDDVLEKIKSWSEAYPLDIFPEPDFKKAHEALQTVGITLDAVSASNMRYVITEVWKMLKPFKVENATVSKDARSNEQEKSAAPIAQEPLFCWLVELFQRRGNSMGRYHTGLTGLDNQSRSTADPCQAKRYTKDEAEYAADALNVHMKACEWRAVEHGFHVVSAAPQVAQEPVAPQRMDLYSELAEALGSDCMDSHSGRLDRAKRANAAFKAAGGYGAAPIAAPAGWIPVAERLPEQGVLVMSALANGRVWHGFHADGKWNHLCEGEDDYDATPTHWQPIPASPTAPDMKKG